MHSAKCRHQSPEWMILNHVNRFIQGEFIGFQVVLDSLYPLVQGHPSGLLQFSKVEAVNVAHFKIELS